IVALSLAVWVGGHELTRSEYGQPAPDVVLAQLDGTPQRLGDTGGKLEVVNLWATWCPPCRREMPLLAKLSHDRPDVTFSFVNQGESAETVRAFLAGQNLKLSRVLLDRDAAIPRYYATAGVPVTLFLTPDGHLADLHMGELTQGDFDSGLAKAKQKAGAVTTP
ncbi:MAG: TlpA disulfide reductase family protein, partial [Asticcacaulis sp.]